MTKIKKAKIYLKSRRNRWSNNNNNKTRTRNKIFKNNIMSQIGAASVTTAPMLRSELMWTRNDAIDVSSASFFISLILQRAFRAPNRFFNEIITFWLKKLLLKNGKNRKQKRKNRKRILRYENTIKKDRKIAIKTQKPWKL